MRTGSMCRAAEVGRDANEVKITYLPHGVGGERCQGGTDCTLDGRGYYEYSLMLFDAPGFEWNGPDCEELKKQVWPDFITILGWKNLR